MTDAVKAGSPPGTLYRFTDENLADKSAFLRTAHGIDFPHVLKTAKMLGNSPKEVVFIGVEPEDMDEGMELSKNLQGKVAGIITLVMREIRSVVPVRINSAVLFLKDPSYFSGKEHVFPYISCIFSLTEK